jgi:hypothetical protein
MTRISPSRRFVLSCSEYQIVASRPLMGYFSTRYGRPDMCQVYQSAGSEEQDCAGGLLFRYVWGVLSAAAQGQTSSSTQQLLAS